MFVGGNQYYLGLIGACFVNVLYWYFVVAIYSGVYLRLQGKLDYFHLETLITKGSGYICAKRGNLLVNCLLVRNGEVCKLHSRVARK